MTQAERRNFLIGELLREQTQYAGMEIPADEQGHEEKTGGAKITQAYDLPCGYVLHIYGEFHFPNEKAAEIAVRTVEEYRQRAHSGMEVIFNVFKDTDYQIYQKLLG